MCSKDREVFHWKVRSCRIGTPLLLCQWSQRIFEVEFYSCIRWSVVMPQAIAKPTMWTFGPGSGKGFLGPAPWKGPLHNILIFLQFLTLWCIIIKYWCTRYTKSQRHKQSCCGNIRARHLFFDKDLCCFCFNSINARGFWAMLDRYMTKWNQWWIAYFLRITLFTRPKVTQCIARFPR